MRKNWLKKIIPLTLSAGIMVGVPAFTQPVLPVGIASVAEAAAPVQWNVGKELAGSLAVCGLTAVSRRLQRIVLLAVLSAWEQILPIT